MTRPAAREGTRAPVTHWAAAVLSNSLGQYDQALAAAEQGGRYPDDLGLATWSLVELIEAAARTGRPDRAASALQRLCACTSAIGTDWTLGIEARCRALLASGVAAEQCYQEAVERLKRAGVQAELARAHLLYGEWLRRQNRRLDARRELETASRMLAAAGLDGFAQRASRELLATGETVRKRDRGHPGELTPQEARIARLARDGHTNSEIGVQMYLSLRTVEWHLRKVFAKLDISSRRQLREALPESR
jgi:DNA-binding CsgD family transcriptional regulator